MKTLFEHIKSCFKPAKTASILIIDDSPIDTKVVVKALSADYEVLTASNGQDGISLAAQKKPDLIVLDYMMPGLNGPQVCCLLKEDVRTKDIPVIFLTSIDTPRGFVSGLEQGAESYLTKPVNPGDLRREAALRIKNCACNGKDF